MTTEVKIPVALGQYLKNFPEINTIVLHLDNDKTVRLETKNIKINYGM